MIVNQPGPDRCPAADLQALRLKVTKWRVGKFVDDGLIFLSRQWGKAKIVFDVSPGTVGEQQVDAFTSIPAGGIVQCCRAM